jgi:succinate dehydrogenase/fumarate reductase flavoprotein subunit
VALDPLAKVSESLRNDGRIWVPKKAGDDRPANDIPEEERDYYLERKYPAFGNLTPRDVASRNARTQIVVGVLPRGVEVHVEQIAVALGNRLLS